MARVKLSEHKAKSLLFSFLDIPYTGISFDAKNPIDNLSLSPDKKYVVKVDQGVKKRFKRGLIGINKSVDEAKKEVKRIADLGFQYFIIEEYVPHDEKDEQYLSIERMRDGYKVLYSSQGGVNIEEEGNVQEVVFSLRNEVKGVGDLSDELLTQLLQYFDEYYLSFMEINPFVTSRSLRSGQAFLRASPSSTNVSQGKPIILDLAVEVDSAAQFFVDGGWTETDFRFGEHTIKTEEEKNIEELAHKSQASFKFDLLNPDGSIWLLLSGGGASIAVADEGYNLGYGKKIANYGEYSGNPNEQETYLYTQNLLSLLLKSQDKRKVLIIAGAVANFTDVAKTFKGIIRAIDEVSNQLQEQQVKVYVRRGGPNQTEGLKIMEEFLIEHELYGDVKGPELVLTDIVREAIRML